MTARELASEWWAWTAPLAVQAAVFAAIVLVLDRLLERRGPPRLRLALWLLAALRFVLPPTLSSPVSFSAWLPCRETTSEGGEGLDATWLLIVWLAGVLLLAVVAARQSSRIRRATRGRPAPERVRRAARGAARRLSLSRVPAVVLSENAPTAFVSGILRPVVTLPLRAPSRDVGPMLLHELAHVKRGDLLLDAGLSLLCVVFWFHPAAWIVRRRAAELREICCDATVASALGRRSLTYRDALHRAAARLLDPPQHTTAFMSRRCGIVARLRALERGPSARPRLAAVSTAVVAVLFGAIALPMSRQAPDDLDAARRLVADAMSGADQPGCIRLHLAAMRVAASQR